MAKTEHNSTRCGCCHRLMPRKAGKRKTCSDACRSTLELGAKFQTREQRISRRRQRKERGQ